MGDGGEGDAAWRGNETLRDSRMGCAASSRVHSTWKPSPASKRMAVIERCSSGVGLRFQLLEGQERRSTRTRGQKVGHAGRVCWGGGGGGGGGHPRAAGGVGTPMLT